MEDREWDGYRNRVINLKKKKDTNASFKLLSSEKYCGDKGEQWKNCIWRTKEEMRHWWRQTGGRTVTGRMPIWCLHLLVNVMSSVWLQMTSIGRGQVKTSSRVSISSFALSTIYMFFQHLSSSSCSLWPPYSLFLLYLPFQNVLQHSQVWKKKK